MARCTPVSSRPGTSAGRAARSAPTGEHDRVVAPRAAARRSRSTPTSTPVTELGALGPHLRRAAGRVLLLHLEVGDAVAQQAAEAVVALVDGDGVPGPGELLGRGEPGRARSRRPRPSCRSALGGGCGLHAAVRPRPGRRSSTSTCLMVTGVGWLMPSTHAASHGAGQSRPVNSGKLLVACSRSLACGPVAAAHEVVPLGDQVAQRAAAEWQNGMPQSMQRLAWSRSCARLAGLRS